MTYLRQLWEADESKRIALRKILRDPVFLEATSLALFENPPTVSSDPAATGLQGAKAAGMHELIEILSDISKYGDKVDVKPPTPRKAAWGHKVEERSSFDPSRVTTPTKPQA